MKSQYPESPIVVNALVKRQQRQIERRLAQRARLDRGGRTGRQIPFGSLARDTATGRRKIALAVAAANADQEGA